MSRHDQEQKTGKETYVAGDVLLLAQDRLVDVELLLQLIEEHLARRVVGFAHAEGPADGQRCASGEDVKSALTA